MLDKIEIRSIVEHLREELLPIGSILIYPSEKIPSSFLPCDGSELSKKAYPELYALIKGTWGETKYTFFLPDLQGQFIRGWDKEGNVDPERKFGYYQEDAMQGHSHNVKISSNGSHKHNVYYSSQRAVTSVGGLGNTGSSYSFWEVYGESISEDARTTDAGSHKHDITILEPRTSTFQTARYSIETRPKNVALMFCIKVK